MKLSELTTKPAEAVQRTGNKLDSGNGASKSSLSKSAGADSVQLSKTAASLAELVAAGVRDIESSLELSPKRLDDLRQAVRDNVLDMDSDATAQAMLEK